VSGTIFPDDIASLLRPQPRRGAPTILFFEELDDEPAAPAPAGPASPGPASPGPASIAPATTEPAAPKAAAAVKVEPMPGEAELARARAEGFAHGNAVGQASALAAAEQATAAVLATLTAGFATATAAADMAAAQAREAAAATLARLLLATLARMLPALCARHGATEAAALARAILPGLGHETRATIRVNPQALPAMEAVLAALDPQLRARVALAGSDVLEAGDLRVEWQDGAAVRDTAAIWAAISDALAPLGFSDVGHAITEDAAKETLR